MIARAILIGNLTRDPELRHTAGGTAVCTLSVAVNQREKKDGQWGDRPSYFDVTVYGNMGENCARYLAKGSACGIDGHLRQDRWEKDGAKRSKIVLIADTVQFLSRKSEESESSSGSFSAPAADTTFTTPDADFGGDDDIPF